tara:strand:+ start:8446 stop:8565 length:120 start_codon:yes stop_codon:yes gene_type:complete
MLILEPASPMFVMPTFRQLRELSKEDFKKFAKEYREYNS